MRGPREDGFIPLVSGAYSARSMIADAQRCINLYPEINPEDTDPGASVTHYPRPGTVKLGNGPPNTARGRGLFTSSKGKLYAVVGSNVYYIDQSWTYTLIGTIGNVAEPVSYADNGTTAVIVDGTEHGYTFTLATNAWLGLIQDGSGTFNGSVHVDYVDTFLTFAKLNSNEWFCSDSGEVKFNALQVGGAASFPDNIITHMVNLRQVWLLKQFTSEIWFLSGTTPFPFEEWPNVFVHYGCAAPYSVSRADSNLFWLSRNKDGQCIAVTTEGYAVKAISTRALEFIWTNYPTVQDCLTYTYQQSGHTFVVFHFPTADESWGYDLSTKQWHQRVWIDNNGLFHRERIAFHALVSRKDGYPDTNVGMDWATGQIYKIDQNAFTDDGHAIPCIRSFPHVTDGLKEITAPVFIADMQTGTIPNTGEIDQTVNPWSQGWSGGFGPLIVDQSPQIACRISKDGGGSWGNYRQKAFISAGRYRSMLRWRSWGMGRDLVYELAWPAFSGTSLQGAYIEPIRHGA